MVDLNDIRNKIDKIDNEIVKLFCERMDICKEVARYKIDNDMPVYHPKREQEIIKRLSEKAPKQYKDGVASLYTDIMDISKVLQKDMMNNKKELVIPNGKKGIDINSKVACQGVKGAYSNIACEKVFTNPDITFCEKFEDVFSSVKNGECEYGVVPIENTCAGSVTDNYDLLYNNNLYIVESITLQIDHCLLAKEGISIDEITKIYSHTQALHQCSDFLNKYEDIEKIPYSNTAVSAKLVAQGNEKIGAIASKQSAKEYGLNIIKESIQNQKRNFTRFVVIARQPVYNEKNQTVSIVMRLEHKPSSLYKVMSNLASRNINMLKLQSRPIPECPFEFMFYCDFCGNIENKKIIDALNQINDQSIFLKILGNYNEIII